MEIHVYVNQLTCISKVNSVLKLVLNIGFKILNCPALAVTEVIFFYILYSFLGCGIVLYCVYFPRTWM